MSDDDARAQARVGTVLSDKWTLERLVGVGGMAAVYAGKHRNGAKAAVKVLHPALARIPEVVERFLREGYAANKVEHPGAVKVLDDDTIKEGPDQGAPYLVMELLDGASLEDRIESGAPIGERELLRLLGALLEVLEVAHAAGVVHRDLKPENILALAESTTDDPKIKVLDFGLARVAESRIRTQAGFALGTPSYMPPEQAAGRVDEIDGRADIFAVGATAFRILAGRTVHPGKNAVEIALKMSQVPAPPLRSVAPFVSEPVAAIVDRACAFKREDRYQSASEMLADVRRAIADLDKVATATTAQAPIPVEAKTIAVEPAMIVEEREAPPIASATTEESIHIPGVHAPKRRRSLIPLVTVLVLVFVFVQVVRDTMNPELTATIDAAVTRVIEAGQASVVFDASEDARGVVLEGWADAELIDAPIDAEQEDAGTIEDASQRATASSDAEVPIDASKPTVHKDASAPPHATTKPAIKPPTTKPTGTGKKR